MSLIDCAVAEMEGGSDLSLRARWISSSCAILISNTRPPILPITHDLFVCLLRKLSMLAGPHRFFYAEHVACDGVYDWFDELHKL